MNGEKTKKGKDRGNEKEKESVCAETEKEREKESGKGWVLERDGQGRRVDSASEKAESP